MRALSGQKTIWLPCVMLGVLVGLLSCLGVPLSWAEDASLPQFLAKIQRASDEVHTFSSAFTQEKHLALFTRPVVFQGTLAISRPDKLRWAFRSPVPSVLLLHGEGGTRCSSGEPAQRFQLASDPVMHMVAAQLWLWLGGDYNRLEEHYILAHKAPATLLVTPKEQTLSTYISQVSITFDTADLQPKTVEIMEPGGDMTRIVFHGARINAELPDSLFTVCTINE